MFVYRGVHVVVLPRVLLTDHPRSVAGATGLVAMDARYLCRAETRRYCRPQRRGAGTVRHGGYRFAVSQKDCGGGQRANHRGYAGTVAGNGCGHHLGKGAGYQQERSLAQAPNRSGRGRPDPCAQSNGRRLYGGYQALLSQRRFSNPGVGLYLGRRRGPGGRRSLLQ